MAEDGLKKTHFEKRHSSICSFRKQVTVLFVPFNQKVTVLYSPLRIRSQFYLFPLNKKVTVLSVPLNKKGHSSICSWAIYFFVKI